MKVCLGVLPLNVRKTGDRELELFALCIIINDQSLIPVHLRLEISPNSDEVLCLELKLGERKDDAMLPQPYETYNQIRKGFTP